ncbi:MAG TPA: chitosanase [Candidatus Kryptobacter bacterium]|nr:MAG: peptidoglycan-binding protein [Ignavibacteriae bacterium 37-53-5]HQT92300.1 chitosanase [Candidatus Kryptobacter bacterium]
MVTPSNKSLIERIVNVFETGSADGRYDAIAIINDGVNGSRQITYGRSQTTEQGNLKELLAMYVGNNGLFSGQFSSYNDRLGIVPLADDGGFIDLLRRAAREDPLMRQAQDDFFERRYYSPAQQFFDANRFELPLSMLVIYDSFIHSGRIPDFLRRRFGESPPARGGDEKLWTAAYVGVRHEWLTNHTNPILRKTIYRTQCFKEQIAADNWLLDKLPVAANGVQVFPIV